MELSFLLAFGAGFLSFISPCCLALYPVFLSYITGISVTELKENKKWNWNGVPHTFVFLLGFSSVFLVMGFSTSYLADFFIVYKDVLRMSGALILFMFGVILTGLWTPIFLLKERRMNLGKRKRGYIGTFIVGIGSAAGWTPCTGPILAGVIALIATNPSNGFLYMLFYVLGFSIPFFLMSFLVGKSRYLMNYSSKVMKIGGWFMILLGIILYFDGLTKLTTILIDFTGFRGF